MDQKWMNFKIFLPKIKFLLLLFFWPNVHLHWVWVCHYIIYISYFEKETKGPKFHIYITCSLLVGFNWVKDYAVICIYRYL